ALNRNVPIGTPIYRSNGNLLLDRLLGAEVHFCAEGETRAARSETIVAELRGRGEVPYYIPTGGSTGTGALGYAAVMLELLQQAKDLGIAIDRIVVASSSGGTQAGLVVGRALAQADVPILGVDVDGEPDELLAMVQSVARDGAEKVGLRRNLADSAF